MYCIRVRRSDGVHWHPSQDEAAQTVQLQEEKRYLRYHGPHFPSSFSFSFSNFQLTLLERCPLYTVNLHNIIENMNFLIFRSIEQNSMFLSDQQRYSLCDWISSQLHLGRQRNLHSSRYIIPNHLNTYSLQIVYLI